MWSIIDFFFLHYFNFFNIIVKYDLSVLPRLNFALVHLKCIKMVNTVFGIFYYNFLKRKKKKNKEKTTAPLGSGLSEVILHNQRSWRLPPPSPSELRGAKAPFHLARGHRL